MSMLKFSLNLTKSSIKMFNLNYFNLKYQISSWADEKSARK